MDELKPSVLYEWAEENEAVLKEMGVLCKDSKVGTHKCSVQTRYGWCCDVCLENELMWLYSRGVHTIGSCCGHGNRRLSSILVVGDSSKEKMEALGYALAEIQNSTPNMASYTPKTPLPYERDNKSIEQEGGQCQHM